jgi:hypothetical protein
MLNPICVTDFVGGGTSREDVLDDVSADFNAVVRLVWKKAEFRIVCTLA